MELTQRQRKDLYLWCLQEGLTLNYGKATLCDLRNFRHSAVYNDRRYQVHCDDNRYPWSMIYDDAEAAVTKFMEIRTKIRTI